MNIKHVAWRNGRPRFSPSQTLRDLGFKGRDFRHADGAWFTAEEVTLAMAKTNREIAQTIARRRQGIAFITAHTSDAPAPALTLGEAVRWFLDLPTSNGCWIEEGRRRVKPLAHHTVRSYIARFRLLEREQPSAWNFPARDLGEEEGHEILHRFEVKHGPPSVAQLRSGLSTVWKVTPSLKFTGNPWASYRQSKSAIHRLRCASFKEINTMVAVADHLGRPELGDMILLGCLTGQRQNDRLSMQIKDRLPEGILITQQKTGAKVLVPEMPELTRRLDAAFERRKAKGMISPYLIIDETTGRPWSYAAYSYLFALCRREACYGIPHETLGGSADNLPAWKIEPCPSIMPPRGSGELWLRDQDFRDTAVTWLARASCSIPEIISITGHSAKTAYSVIEHYLGRDLELANSAVSKLKKWLHDYRAYGRETLTPAPFNSPRSQRFR